MTLCHGWLNRRRANIYLGNAYLLVCVSVEALQVTVLNGFRSNLVSSMVLCSSCAPPILVAKDALVP